MKIVPTALDRALPAMRISSTARDRALPAMKIVPAARDRALPAMRIVPAARDRALPAIAILPATLEHARRLRLRAGDAAEIAALGLTPLAALEQSLARSLWAETYVVEGEIAAMTGLGRSSLLGGHGVPWLLTGPACERHARIFLAESRRQVARMLAEASPLINFVHADYARAVRWLGWLGFTLEPPVAIRGARFRRFILHKPQAEE